MMSQKIKQKEEGQEEKRERKTGEREGDREKRDQDLIVFFKDTPTNDLRASC